MSDALPLPPRPDLDYYRTLARELQTACAAAAGEAADTIDAWAARWAARLTTLVAVDRCAEWNVPAERVAAFLAELARRRVDVFVLDDQGLARALGDA